MVLRGFLMGSADIVPGVSGGTVALIVGIYERLVTAISRFDGELVKLLLARDLRGAAARVDLRFLAFLGIGIAAGIAALASSMEYLLTEQRTFTLAVFFGLILASTILVARMVAADQGGVPVARWLAGLVAAGFAFWLVGHDQLGGYDHLAYYFVCGMFAICAMILPGISGAYILWMLGAYEHVTSIIKNAVHFQFTIRDATVLAVFACGCAVGLIGFAKVLRWLLSKAHALTMAVLCGFMAGSLRKVWPFQVETTVGVEELKHKRFKNVMPAEIDSTAIACLALAIGAMAAVLTIEWWATRRLKADAAATPSG
ncbi:MAG: DUF368 domain-containing protein [Planctomycetaceae bacterium]|nr:DUF368 domain-containing protein [Planctomycetaceae bacterium]